MIPDVREDANAIAPVSATMPVRPRTLKSPILAEPRPRTDSHDVRSTAEVVDLRSLSVPAAGVVAIGVPFAAAGQPGLALAAAACTTAMLVLRHVGQRVRFGLGDGFLGYRDASRWPHGVQEEYDVTWGRARGRASGNRV